VIFRSVLVALLIIAAACGDDVPPPCADVGCPASTHPFLICRGVRGTCECPQEDGAKIECLREATP